MQWCGKHLCSSEWTHRNRRRGFLWGPPPGYKDDMRQLELEMRESSELAELRRNGKKVIRLCEVDFIVCYNYSETVMNPLPGYE
jgi:hypothetical protein